ncbi:MAG: helix-turn-helix transcriptional regulator [Actinomycetaceae bacterium]|nr:helix-turn-helix transcriptional regulator [Actinomycetaceae bacterium]
MDNRVEVNQFLTALRARITPDEAGLVAFGTDRRVPGLRREEVAQLAGVSTAYYTRMERGDLRGVSEGVLYSLARALRLDEAETLHLFDLAHTASGSSRRPLPHGLPAAAARRRTPDPRVLERLTRVLDSMFDVPALAVNYVGDPVASNALGRALFPHLFPDDAEPVNHFHYLFLDERSRVFYPDWETSARESVSSLRLLVGHDPADRALTGLVEELSERSERFRDLWQGHAVRVHASGTKRIDHPLVGLMVIGYDVLSVEATPGLTVTTYLPEGGSPSEDAMRRLRRTTA